MCEDWFGHVHGHATFTGMSLRFRDGHYERDANGELCSTPSVDVDAVFRRELDLRDVVDLLRLPIFDFHEAVVDDLLVDKNCPVHDRTRRVEVSKHHYRHAGLQQQPIRRQASLVVPRIRNHTSLNLCDPKPSLCLPASRL